MQYTAVDGPCTSLASIAEGKLDTFPGYAYVSPQQSVEALKQVGGRGRSPRRQGPSCCRAPQRKFQEQDSLSTAHSRPWTSLCLMCVYHAGGAGASSGCLLQGGRPRFLQLCRRHLQRRAVCWQRGSHKPRCASLPWPCPAWGRIEVNGPPPPQRSATSQGVPCRVYLAGCIPRRCTSQGAPRGRPTPRAARSASNGCLPSFTSPAVSLQR